MTAQARLTSPKKIAVLHAKALGDLIVTLPALAAIKETYPEAELVLLAKPWAKDFLGGRPSPVDRIIAVPPYPGVHDTVETKGAAPPRAQAGQHEELAAFFEAMQNEQFDAVLHMQGDGKSANPFIKRFGAPLTAGMRNAPAESIDRFIPYVHYQSEVLRNLEIAGLIGATTERIEPHLNVTDTDRQEAEPTVSTLRQKKYVILHIGADDIRRLWPADKFAQVADALADEGYAIVLTGTPKEEPMIASVMQAMSHPAVGCTGLSLGGLAALLQQSALVVSNDTGPLHVARAVGAKTVGIFWAPNVLNWGPLTRARHRLAISWQLECPRCHVKPLDPWPFQPTAPDCDHPYSFVEAVPTKEVIAAATALLGQD